MANIYEPDFEPDEEVHGFFQRRARLGRQAAPGTPDDDAFEAVFRGDEGVDYWDGEKPPTLASSGRVLASSGRPPQKFALFAEFRSDGVMAPP